MIAVLLWAIAAAQPLPPELVKHAQAGMAAQKQGKHDEAITEFTRVTELAPTLAAGFVNLGNAYLQKGDYVSALKPLRRSLELDSSLVGAHQMLGFALLSAGYAAEAIPHLEKAQAADGLGIALYQSGRAVEAIPHLRAALDQRPSDPDLLYYLGRAAAQVSKQSFDTLQAAHPDAARTQQLNGETQALQRKLPEAEKAYREALRLRPNAPEVHLLLGELFAAAGDWEKAEAEFRAEAAARPGNAEAAYRLGHALLERGKVKEARAELERANGLAPSMPETLYQLGKACSLDGDAAAAEKHWLAQLAVEKESALAAQAHFGLAAIYRKQGKAAQAEAAIREHRRLRGR